MSLGTFNADEDLTEKQKQECVERIEHAMQNHCTECETGTVDNKLDMCIKHLKMYSTLYP